MTESLNILGIDIHDNNVMQLLNPYENATLPMDDNQVKKIKALRKVIKTYLEAKASKQKKINKAKDVYEMMKGRFSGLGHEELHAIFLRSNNSIIDSVMISKGGLNSTIIDQRQIAKEALLRQAAGVIITHNHPSGTPIPGKSDIEATKKLNKALKLIDIILIDHVVISQGLYYSFMDEQILNA